MKNHTKVNIVFLSTVFALSSAFAAGYSENLYLCDLGIISSNTLNERGVDFIQYSLNAQTSSVSAYLSYSTALTNALNLDAAFDRWNPANGIENVSINLESDYYGTQYFLEYCYTWDRLAPVDNTYYDVNFSASLPTVIPFTNFTADTKCSLMDSNAAVTNVAVLQSLTATVPLTSDFISMRCTIRLNFTESAGFTARPHNGGLLDIDPGVTVKAEL